MSDVWVVQHTDCETLGTIAGALDRVGVGAQVVRIFEQQPLPAALGEAAGLIIMGGPMGVYEQAEYPFLSDEMRLLEQALRQRKPVLGVCLGSQLLAATLGGAVTKGKCKEIGWHPIRLAAAAASDQLWRDVASPFVGYHWHGDVFEVPRGAVPLASSGLTACQAFRYGDNAYGFLFHMEVTEQIIAGMVRAFPAEMEQAGVTGDAIITGAKNHLATLQAVGDRVFSRWAQLLIQPTV
ncbi:MAG: gamma-glutamyl-gamma-aminobutyrate hydrolase family protein [Deltaproteobacteria bacterium]|nr:gamma-glutamyl-gamma-aminobutyrate hydrolase family protein [Deltaproteobacteria bacterium]